MSNQQDSLSSQDLYLRDGDWVQFQFQNYALYSDGFKSGDVCLKFKCNDPLSFLFTVTHPQQYGKNSKKIINFNDPIILIHRLSNKYLSYNPNLINKSQFRLKTNLTNQCHFILKPLYKCQTLRGNLVRNRQECTLNPAISQYVENISLVAGKMQKQAQGKLSVFLKKNQFTGLKIVRKNICKKTHNQISNYQIYQLYYIQQKVPLCYEKSENHEKINFKNVENNYSSFLMIEHQQFNLEEQKTFRNKDYVSIKILANNSFIGFTQNGAIFLSKQKSSDTRFKIQMYSKDNDLVIDSLIQFQHAKTGKYLSFNRGGAALDEYQTKNVFELKQINSQQLKDNLFVNLIYCSLKQQMLENSQIKRRRSIQSILKELEKFIFKNKQALVQFSKLKQLKICISQNLQNLFASIGFISILRQICQQTYHQVQDKIISKSSEQVRNINSSKASNENIEEENLYQQCCIVLMGICRGNKKNIWELSKYFQMFFEHVGKIKGPIKLLYYLIANSSEGINIFENIQYPVKKHNIKALQYFCQTIYKSQITIQNRIKIIKFLHGCLLDENQEKSYVHELILMSALAENKLRNIFFSLSNDSDHFLIVDTKLDKEELSQMVNRQEKYEKQLQLLLEQIDLLITISSRASKRHVYFFRDIISEEMVNKYLKIDLNPQFKSIFLKILVNVYLNKNNHISPQSFIIVTNPKKKIFDQAAIFRKLSTLSTLSHKLLDESVEMQEVNEDKFKFISNVSSLNSIKDYILRTVKAKLQSNRVEDELIYCLYAFSNFLELGACEEKEGEDVLNLVTRYLEKEYQLYKIFNIELVTKYLGLLEHSLTHKIKIKANQLFARIRANYKESQARNKYSKKIIEIFNIFANKQFNEFFDNNLFSLLTLIISHSLETKCFAIFQRTSQFLHKINNISYFFLESIKDSILIESDNSNDQLKRINKLFNALSDYIIDYIYLQKSKEADAITLRKYICQILSQSIQLLQNHDQDETINTISQKIMGSFNFFQIVTQLICQKQLDLQRHESDQMFHLIFKFIKLYLLNSDDNFLKKAHYIQKLSVLFKYTDKGQVKLLWNLTCIKLVAIRLNNFLLESWISSAKQAFKYIIYIPLGLLKVIGGTNGPSQQQQNIDQIVKNIIQGGILRQLVKIQVSNLDTALIVHHQNANSVEQWLFYMTLLLKLLLNLIQKTTVPKQKLFQNYRQFFPMKIVIKLIDETFTLQFDQKDQQTNTIFIILIKMIKKQLIELFTALYLEADQKENEYLIYLAQRLANRLTMANSENYSDDYLYKNLVYFNKHNQSPEKIELRQALIEYLKAETSSHFQLSPEAFHTYINNIFLFVNSYYNFLFKICERLTENRYESSDSSNYLLTDTISMREMMMFLDNLFKKYKEFINEKMTYSQYSGYYVHYNSSIKLTEQITNKKVGLNYNYQPSDQQTLTLLQGQQYFQNPDVDFVLKSYLQSKSKLQKYLYESVLIMMHNQNIQVHSQRSVLINNGIKTIVDALVAEMRLNFSNFKEKSKILCNFILTNDVQPQWDPHLQYTQIISKIVSPNINMNHSDLKYYIYTEITLLRNYFSFNENIFKRYKITSNENEQQLINQLNSLKNKVSEIILKQISFYDGHIILNQSALYFQCKSLNYHLFPKHLSIQLILQWLLLKVQYSIQNIEKYYNLIIDTIHLVKAYSRFLFQYDKRYLSGQLHHKIQLCLKILFRAISGSNIKILMAMIEQQIWNDLNLFMSLNDSLQHNLDQLQLKTYDMIKSLSRIKLSSLSSAYAQAILQLYNNSMTIYGQNAQIIDPSHYPLVPIKSFYHELKYLAILIMKQFKNLPLNISAQFFSKIDVKYLQFNICNHFEKYNYLNSSYTIAAAYPQLRYKGHQIEQLSKSLCLINGVELTALKMYIDSLNGNKQLQKKYTYYCYEGNQSPVFRSFLKTLNNFVIDFVLLFLSCIWSAVRKNKRQNDYKSAVDFFIAKIGRVQLAFEDKIYEHDFMVYPECSIPTQLRKSLLSRLNFISIQLKRESILLQTQRIILHYQNQLNFFKRFHNVSLVLYVDTYTQVFKIFSYLIVITNNVLLLINQIDLADYHPVFHRAFQLITIINFIISLVILILYCIKKMPLVAKTNSYDLNQGIGYFGKTYQQKSEFKKKLILGVIIVTDKRFIYNLIYALFVALIFLNPVFASVLLLDVLAHIPTLKTLLLSIWRPRYQLLLTMVTYIILQYFFSIFLYFLFKDNAAPYCEHLGQCFTFIFATTFKSVNGFVGYLFQRDSVVDKQLSVFELFEDFYVIVIYQIIMALILAIVIESFTVSRAEKLKQIDSIKAACIICNIERSKFNAKSKFQFKGHISISHNLYSYINFKYGLTFKKFQYMNDFQISALTNKSSAWIPDGKTKQLFSEEINMKKDEHNK